jgi:hypothetical protein
MIFSEQNFSSVSFKDPDGFVFREQGVWYRAITPRGLPSLRKLEDSGLYQQLVKEKILLKHEEIEGASFPNVAAVIRPEQVPFISYACEWSHEQLRDAALVTLRAHQQALEKGMWMADANAANIQFVKGRPVLLDTLSLKERQGEGPWPAYRQFCEHFLGPLALSAYAGPTALRTLAAFPDGLPLPMVSAMLPLRSWFRPGLLLHLHLHARAISSYTGSRGRQDVKPAKISKESLLGLAQGLESCVRSLHLKDRSKAWLSYYAEDMLDSQYLPHKRQLVGEWLKRVEAKTVGDFGANTGEFSMLAQECGAEVVSLEGDPLCVDEMYDRLCRREQRSVLPLVANLAQPTPASGWNAAERNDLFQRCNFDAVLALALVHHLAIACNVPLRLIAEMFARFSKHLIIEFVPKQDANTQRLLKCREDIFPDYTESHFSEAFGRHFEILERVVLKGTERCLFLMKNRKRN